jgi:hypothetical protein
VKEGGGGGLRSHKGGARPLRSHHGVVGGRCGAGHRRRLAPVGWEDEEGGRVGQKAGWAGCWADWVKFEGKFFSE